MEPYTTDQEQIETLKGWWRKNGKSILGGLFIGLGAVYGWRAWQTGVTAEAEAASAAYNEIVARLRKEKDQAADGLARDFMDAYKDSPYAIFAALTRARMAVEAADFSKAKEQLRWVMEHATLTELRAVARLRLARVLLSEGDPAGAWSLVEQGGDAAVSAAYQEIKGDIRLAQGRPEEARRYYEEALASSAGIEDPALRLKLDELSSGPAKSPP